MRGGLPAAAAAASAAATLSDSASVRRLASVGGSISRSPASTSARASAGRTHRLSTNSASSC